jgi:chromosome segregation ATPase
MEAAHGAATQALKKEKAARLAEADELGEMMAQLSRLEGRSAAAEKALSELESQLHQARRNASELEAEVARTQLEMREALSLAEARGEELEVERMRARNREQELVSALAERPQGHQPQRGRTVPPRNEGEEVADLKVQLVASRDEANQLRKNLESLRKRAARIGDGLKEMRTLFVNSATLFDQLEDRERSIAEARGRSLREARALFLRAAGSAGSPGVPPPLPIPKMPVEDLSEAAELLEEEARASVRMKP